MSFDTDRARPFAEGAVRTFLPAQIAHQPIVDGGRTQTAPRDRGTHLVIDGRGSHQTDRVRAFVRDRAVGPTRLGVQPFDAVRARPFAEVGTFLAAIINRSPMEAARADRSRSASLMVAVSDL
jgi:hypothetical protein